MAYNEKLADAIRDITRNDPAITEKKMFGGVAFLKGGLMFIGVAKDELMVRVGKERHGEARAHGHVRDMDFTGRPMQGYVFVAEPGWKNKQDLEAWITWGLDTIARLPPKKKK